MNVAKLTSNDLPLFLDITTDLFPNMDVPIMDYEEIISYITSEAIKLKLQVIYLGYNVIPLAGRGRSNFLCHDLEDIYRALIVKLFMLSQRLQISICIS